MPRHTLLHTGRPQCPPGALRIQFSGLSLLNSLSQKSQSLPGQTNHGLLLCDLSDSCHDMPQVSPSLNYTVSVWRAGSDVLLNHESRCTPTQGFLILMISWVLCKGLGDQVPHGTPARGSVLMVENAGTVCALRGVEGIC